MSDNRDYRNVNDIKTIFNLKLSEGGTDFVLQLSGLDDWFVLSVYRFFNDNKRTGGQ